MSESYIARVENSAAERDAKFARLEAQLAASQTLAGEALARAERAEAQLAEALEALSEVRSIVSRMKIRREASPNEMYVLVDHLIKMNKLNPSAALAAGSRRCGEDRNNHA